MFKYKLMLPLILMTFCFLIGSVAAIEDSSFDENLTNIENGSLHEQVGVVDEIDTFNADYDENDTLKESESYDNLSISDEISQTSASSNNVLSSSVSVSSQGHTYYKSGYYFKVSPNQYKKINQAIKVGKKHKFLDYGFKFTVKTNKVHIYKKPIYVTKKAIKYKWIYKRVKVSQDTYWDWEFRFDMDKRTTRSGWECYKLSQTDFEYGVPYSHYVHFKKKVKYVGNVKVKSGRYDNIKMRIYANIEYVGSYDYITGQHMYFPWVSFTAMRSGYKNIYLDGLSLMI